MTDEEQPVEPFEWFKAFRYSEVIGEGPTPIPDDIREQATEIQWSNPTTDQQFVADEPEVFARTAPEDFSDRPSATWVPPEEPDTKE